MRRRIMKHDNPMYGLLQSKREPVWDLGLVAAMGFAALLGYTSGPQVLAALFIILFALVRSCRVAARLASLVQGRGIEEVLMARTSVYDLVDGACAFCLRSSLLPAVAFWIWLVFLLSGTPSVVLLWPPCMLVNLVACCYLTQLAVAAGTLARQIVPPILIVLWLGLLTSEAVVLAVGQYVAALPMLLGLAMVSFMARRYTGSVLVARLTPAPSVVRQLRPYRRWGQELDPIGQREACREHHRGGAWMEWLGLVLYSGLAVALGEGGLAFMLMLLVPWFTIWAAYRSSPAIIAEREARSFDVMALTRLGSEHLVDGWAGHGWRPLALKALVPALALGLVCVKADPALAATAALLAFFYLALLVGAAQAGAYAGVWASSQAGSRDGLSGLVLGACFLAGCGLVFMWTLLGWTNREATMLAPWIAAVLTVWVFRWTTLHRMTVESANTTRGLFWPLVVLPGLLVPPISWLAGVVITALVHRQCRAIPGLVLGLAVLVHPILNETYLFRRPHRGGQLTACKSNLKNIGTALEMYSTDFAGRYPTSSSLLTPNYLKTIPTCASVGSVTYVFEMASNPDLYTVVCSGKHHTGAGITTANYPQYTSVTGLLER